MVSRPIRLPTHVLRERKHVETVLWAEDFFGVACMKFLVSRLWQRASTGAAKISTDLSYHQKPYRLLDIQGGKVFRTHDKLILNIEAVRKLRAAGEEIFLLTFTLFSRTATQLPLNMIAVSCFSNRKKFMLDLGYS